MITIRIEQMILRQPYTKRDVPLPPFSIRRHPVNVSRQPCHQKGGTTDAFVHRGADHARGSDVVSFRLREDRPSTQHTLLATAIPFDGQRVDDRGEPPVSRVHPMTRALSPIICSTHLSNGAGGCATGIHWSV
jgi:hypothetical protein